jgi:hypothetical protein
LVAYGLTGIAVLLPAVSYLPVAAQGISLAPGELAARESKAGQDPVALLELVPLAPKDSAGRLRQRVSDLLASQEASVTAAELDKLAARLAAVLPETVRTLPEARQVLGVPTQVARQVLYRRYVEQWTYSRPVPVVLLFDCRTGELPRLQTVRVNRPGKL